ncbi:MAG: ABC transporter permease [Gemmatimonadetes bacterium]|nr:ABC transporter permease [Gemmatimonadota bacterium]
MKALRAFWKSLDRSGRAALIALIVLAIGAMLVPVLASSDPLAIGDLMARKLVPPFSRDDAGGFHLLGTDRFGRDLFVRMMLAGRISLAVGVLGSVLAAGLGTGIGALAGWSGGVVDRIAMAAADTVLAVPRLVLLLVCAALWQPGTTTVVIVLAATGWMGVARLIRAEVAGARVLPYVDAASALGVSPARTLWRHVLPNALGPAVVATTLGIGSAVMLESGLSFLGLGIQPPAPSWGNMIAGGRELIVSAPWVSLAPGLAVIVTVVSATILGDSWRDRLTTTTSTTPARILAERA